MLNLKVNKFLCSIPFLGLMGCAISSYRVTNQWEGRNELHVTPDRILLQCAHVTDEIELTHMFYIHILDDQNTVLDVLQGNNTSKKGCDMRIKGAKKVLDSGHDIYIGAMGDPYRPVVMDNENYTFPEHGTFHGNGRVLQFHVIANENGKCYHAYRHDNEPCLGDEFPITGVD